VASERPSAPNLDLSLILRGLAAAGVVWWHVAGFGVSSLPALNVPGRVSVWIFFTLSGYVIAYGFLHGRYTFCRRDVIRFYANRFLRLMPLFWLVSLAALAIAWGQGVRIEFGPNGILGEFLALQWSHSYALSGVFWTLGIELQFYIIAPALMFGLVWICRFGIWVRRITLSLIYVSLLLFPAALAVLVDAPVDNRTILGNLAHFLAGMLFLIHVSKLSLGSRKLGTGAAPLLGRALAGCLCIMLAAWLFHERVSGFWSGLGALLTHAGVCLWLRVHVAFEARKVKSGVFAKAGMVLGVLSYGLYAWHDLVMRSLPSISDSLILVLVASLALAFVSNRVLERPVQRFRPK
jgi:exopolysaccharide production protein ExoZ